MRRGTTPKHTFTLPFDTNIVDKVLVVYAQKDVAKIVKKKSDVELDGNQVIVHLTQEDTILLKCQQQTDIQVAAKTVDGNVFRSDLISVNTTKCLYDEVL